MKNVIYLKNNMRDRERERLQAILDQQHFSLAVLEVHSGSYWQNMVAVVLTVILFLLDNILFWLCRLLPLT